MQVILSAEEVRALEDNIALVVPDPVRDRLRIDAAQRFGGDAIVPVPPEQTFDTCFRCNGGRYQFWFNTKKDNSTHMVSCAITINV